MQIPVNLSAEFFLSRNNVSACAASAAVKTKRVPQRLLAGSRAGQLFYPVDFTRDVNAGPAHRQDVKGGLPSPFLRL
jgi:hypothetical protein